MIDSLMVQKLANQIKSLDILIQTQVIPKLNQPVVINSGMSTTQLIINSAIAAVAVASLITTIIKINNDYKLRSQEREDIYKLACIEKKLKALGEIRVILGELINIIMTDLKLQESLINEINSWKKELSSFINPILATDIVKVTSDFSKNHVQYKYFAHQLFIKGSLSDEDKTKLEDFINRFNSINDRIHSELKKYF